VRLHDRKRLVRHARLVHLKIGLFRSRDTGGDSVRIAGHRAAHFRDEPHGPGLE